MPLDRSAPIEIKTFLIETVTFDRNADCFHLSKTQKLPHFDAWNYPVVLPLITSWLFCYLGVILLISVMR